MYLLPSTGEGTTDNNPIVLRGYKAADFEALLMILYPSCVGYIRQKCESGLIFPAVWKT
jgi:hypothetical protein